MYFIVSACCFTAFERLVLKELKALKKSVADLARRQQQINGKLDILLSKEADTQVPFDMPDDLVLPLKTELEVNEIEGRLEEKQFGNFLVNSSAIFIHFQKNGLF